MVKSQRQILEAWLSNDWRYQVYGFGGSRSGSKTNTLAWAAGLPSIMHQNLRMLCLRKVQSSADLNIGDEIKQAFIGSMGLPMGTRNSGGITYLEKKAQFLFPTGSLIQIGYCANPGDVDIYIGEQWDGMLIDQGEQWPEKIYDDIRASNRRTTGNKTFQPRCYLSFHPGGIGTEWVHRRIKDPLTRDRGVYYVQSSVKNNYATLERFPGYILEKLNSIKDPIRRAQWLDGDFDAKGGLYFNLAQPTKDGRHGTVHRPNIPFYADWYGCADWGSDDPFAYLIFAVWKDQDGGLHIHYRKEVYSRDLLLDEQAQAAREAERSLRQDYPHMHDIEMRWASWETANPIVRDSATQSWSVTSAWASHGFHTFPAFRYGRVAGWEQMKWLIKHRILTIDPEDCPNLLREIKAAVRGFESEDIDKKCKDHALDCMRYGNTGVLPIDYSLPTPEDEYMKRLVGRI